jgi:NADPH2:quinone reductase
MRAVLMHETGGPEVLVLEEVPVPVPGQGQVLVRTEAIAVSTGETRMRAGVYPMSLPRVLGAEAAGVVLAGPDPGLVGERVVMVTGGAGAYAEFVAVDAGKVARVPDGLSAVDAVASAAPGALALALLHRAGFRGGETVLVEGSRGRVGGYLVKHATEFGAGRVIAVTRDDWPELAAVDVVFEMIGGEVTGQVLGAMAPGGRMLLYGMITGRPPVLDPAVVMSQGLEVIGCGGPQWFQQVVGVHYPEFLGLAASGRTYVQEIDDILPLADAAEAHRRVESGARGRVLLAP